MNKYEYIVNQSRDFITLINKEYVYEVVNDSYCNAMGIKKEDIVNKRVYDIWGQERFNSLIKKDIDRCFQGEDVHLIDNFKFGDGVKYMHVTYYPYYENDEIVAALVFSHDITKIQEMEIKLFDYEFKDSLTGLFNKKSFDIMLEMELYKAERSKLENKRSLIIINIVNMTKINQLYGYEIGDTILEKTGIRIKNILRNSDYIFRFYEKEFAVILTGPDDNKDISGVVNKIRNEISKPYKYKNSDLSVECNIGVAIYPYDGKNGKELLNNALSSVREAKKSNDGFLFFNQDIQKKVTKQTEIEIEIRKSIVDNEFILYYQPIVDCSGKIIGAEALIRWQHPEKGLIPPMDFIPIAEETKTIIDIGKWAFKEVCNQLKKWASEFKIYVSVNFSTIEFDSPHFIEMIKKTIEETGFSYFEHLKIEITETNAMYNFEENVRKILELKELGIDTFIDDFGIGYSSLSYLKKLPVNTFKVDKLFIDNIVTDKEEKKFAESIIKMVKSRNKNVIVEGVSSFEQFEILREFDCDKLQGFYFSKPVPRNEFENYFSYKDGLLPTKKF